MIKQHAAIKNMFKNKKQKTFIQRFFSQDALENISHITLRKSIRCKIVSVTCFQFYKIQRARQVFMNNKKGYTPMLTVVISGWRDYA